MSNVTRRRPRASTVVMGAGAALFAISLAIAAVAYVRTFAEPPLPWNAPAGIHAIFINVALFAAFAAHHSVFARTRIRQAIAALAGDDLERPVYVLTASMLLLMVVGLWRPVPGLAWNITGFAGVAMAVLQMSGIGVVLIAASELGIKQLSGLSPTSSQPSPPPLRSTGLYGFVRHPIYFAWVLMVWPTAFMTGSRLTFAAVTTLYLVLAVPLEERTLRQVFGPAYDDYKRRVPWRMLPGVY